MSDSRASEGFEFYWKNIPRLVAHEPDPAKYARAFDAMTSGRGDDADYMDAAARSAIAFIAEHAFQAGWKLFKEKVHEPYVEDCVPKSIALAALERRGEDVRRALSWVAYDRKNDMPTGESDAIDNYPIPAPTLPEATV